MFCLAEAVSCITSMNPPQFHSLPLSCCVVAFSCCRVAVLEEGRRAPDRQRGCIAAERQLGQSTSSSAADKTLRLSPSGWTIWTHFLHLYIVQPRHERIYCQPRVTAYVTDSLQGD